jgi:hypothetical protein
VRADGLGRTHDLLRGGIRPAEGDVLGDGPREQESFLRDDPELAAERGLGDVAEVDPVERDPTLTGVIEAGEQPLP